MAKRNSTSKFENEVGKFTFICEREKWEKLPEVAVKESRRIGVSQTPSDIMRRLVDAALALGDLSKIDKLIQKH